MEKPNAKTSEEMKESLKYLILVILFPSEAERSYVRVGKISGKYGCRVNLYPDFSKDYSIQIAIAYVALQIYAGRSAYLVP